MISDYSQLDEVAEVIDSLHRTPTYSAQGFPMVRCTDVKYGELDLHSTLRVDDEVALEFSRRYKPAVDDIIITRVGTYGVTARVIDTQFCLGQNTSAIVPKKINSWYLYGALNSNFVWSQIEAGVVGSTQKTLSLKVINALKIPRLGKKQESEIAVILGSLDDRIALLRETNTTLEAISQALFKSWFVDFDPVRAKQEGREPEGIDADTTALFPDSFEESELGLVPKGWNQVPFTDTAHVIGGGTPKTSMPEYWNGDIPWFSVVDAPTILQTATK
jgi:type I restriction enzyme S subunit